ncbi:hypothetical protein PR003_g584 [Phytophthora rubi]|uniref:Aldehyde dehydrogenase domain-containing protein n=1 Tax=Phytophthora rubi TaxID=129364 RepID=A0A6A4G2Q7_9STRA|nr:hypothetical protein PR003_g584 [Phytophthora rubi]
MSDPTPTLKELFVDGKWVAPVHKQYLDVLNPATEEVVASASAEDVDLAVQAAKRAFVTWGFTTGTERAVYLRAMAAAVEKRTEALSRLETIDIGKPLAEAVWDVAGCFQTGMDKCNSGIRAINATCAICGISAWIQQKGMHLRGGRLTIAADQSGCQLHDNRCNAAWTNAPCVARICDTYPDAICNHCSLKLFKCQPSRNLLKHLAPCPNLAEPERTKLRRYGEPVKKQKSKRQKRKKRSATHSPEATQESVMTGTSLSQSQPITPYVGGIAREGKKRF